MESDYKSHPVKKFRSVNWTEREKVLLVQNILEREDELFGRNKGGSREVYVRHKAWAELQEVLNAELDIPRTVEQMRKAYENIKSRAKLKVEQIRESNGSVSYHYINTTPSIQLVIDRLCGKPFDPEKANAEQFEFKPRIYSFGSLGTEDDGSTSRSNEQQKHTENDLSEDANHFEATSAHARPDQDEDIDSGRKRKQLEEDLLEFTVKKVKSECAKLAAETELIQNRLEQEKELFNARLKQEQELFELKKQLINAKIDNVAKLSDGT